MKRQLYLTGLRSCLLFTASTNGQTYIPEWQDKKVKVKSTVDIKAYGFNLGDVKLLSSPFLEAMNSIHLLVALTPEWKIMLNMARTFIIAVRTEACMLIFISLRN